MVNSTLNKKKIKESKKICQITYYRGLQDTLLVLFRIKFAIYNDYEIFIFLINKSFVTYITH